MCSREVSSVVRLVRDGQELAPSKIQLRLGGLFALYAAVLLALLLVHPFRERLFVAITDVLGFVPPLVAGALALAAAQRSRDHVRTGWRLLGVGCLFWGMGDVVWTVYEVVLQQDPFPSIADAGYLIMLPLAAVGLITLTSERRRLAHARPTIDGIAFVLSASALVWLFVLHPTYIDSSASVWQKAIGAAYPVGDLVVVYALVVAVQRRWGSHDAVVLAALLGGMLSLVGADLGFAYLTIKDEYGSTSLVNLGWPYGFLLIAYAARLGAARPLTYASDDSAVNPRDWKLFGALVAVLGALLAAAVRQDSAAVSAPLYVMVGIAAVAVVVRLAINVGLAREVGAQRERLIAWIGQRRRMAA